MAKIHILLIEDNRLLQEGIVSMLDSQSEFEVVARFEDSDAVRQLKSLALSPEVVLMDLGLARTNTLSLMALLQKELPLAKFIAMDMIPDQIDIIEFVKAGGHGFILKNAPIEDWISTIKAVARGEKVLPPSLTNSLFMQIADSISQHSDTLPTESILLTQRERDVVKLIADGLSNKEIAESLHIATFTVKSHVHNILEKLALSTRLQIAAYIRKQENE
ncbi:MAG: response regulator transcription factor [Bacteroidetes bacterium]|nr:response regulator transcription factor [Bacteroidota bacterium]